MQNQNQEHPNLFIRGTFIAAKPPQQRGNYTIREFAVDGSYYNRSGQHVEQIYPLSVFGENCQELDKFKKGDKVIVRFNLRPGKDQSTQKWRWLNVSPWKIEIDGYEQARSQTTSQPVSQPVNASTPIPEAELAVDPADDLPF